MRYFIVFYQTEKISGNCTITTDGNYLSCEQTVNQIIEEQKAKHCLITNIIELPKKDFNIWNS